MHGTDTFTPLLLLLLITVAAAATFLRLRLPAALGYVAVGVAAGPGVLAIVDDVDTIRNLAELGVVLLLFTIGLELSLPALVRLRGALLGLGGAEVVIAAAVTIAAARAMDIPMSGAVVLGGVVVMSSTALVTKQLTDQGELGEPHGRAALGILLFQDVAVVPFLVIVAGLAHPSAAGIPATLALALAKGAGVIAVIVLIGRYALRPALAGVAALRSRELLTLTALAVALGSAGLTDLLGLSPALGAFVAGVVLGEGPYRHTLEAEIRPFRDVLLALFFVSVGMLLDPAILPVAWPWILLLFAALVGFKLMLVFALCRIGRLAVGTSARTALVLAHGGEFGFALLTLAIDGEMLPPDYGQAVLAALLLSMAVAPLALRFNAALVPPRWRPTGPPGPQVPGPDAEGSPAVLVIGFGRVGQHVTRLLDEVGVAWHAVDADPVRVENARAAGEPVGHGDGTRLDVLEAAGLDRASALALTIADPDVAAGIVHQVRQRRAELPILVRAPDDARLETLQAAGATEVVPETLESGLMVGSHLLFLLGYPTERVMERVRAIRHDRYRMLQALFPGGADADPEQPQLRAVTVPEGARAAGCGPEELGLEALGAGVAAVTRAGRRIDAPGRDTRLAPGDVVVLSGTAGALDRAEARLVRG